MSYLQFICIEIWAKDEMKCIQIHCTDELHFNSSFPFLKSGGGGVGGQLSDSEFLTRANLDFSHWINLS